MRRVCLWLAALHLVLGAPALQAQGIAEPEGFRQEAYQAAVPATLNGSPALTTEGAKALWTEGKAIFIDVLPHVPRPAGLPEGSVWNDKPHPSIRGAAWLPEVGRGALADETETYYKKSLSALTKGDRDAVLVLFCKRSCWMSWNAAKRAQSYGYRHVSWYSDGIEGWTEAGLPTATVEPQR